ncbi:MAG: hypothetical protein NTX25_06170, partial [Proteobacteria bacterium]|nr:hypothetical protein [Pseudomonadota bacterium]
MIKSLGRSLAIMCLGWGLHLPLAHASLAQYSMSLDISASDLAFQSSANVKIKIRDPNIKIGACLYVPLEDPLLARTAKIHTLRGQDLRDRAARSYASLKWADSTQFEAKGAGYYQLKKIDSEGFLSLSYNLNLAGWLDRPGPLRFLSDFYPLVLATCPEPETAVLKIPQQIIDFKVQLKAPADWRQVIPGQLSEGVWHHVGSSFQIVLYQSGQVHETILNGSRLRFLYQSKEFLRLEEPVIQILQHHHELLGSWPNEDFVLVESDEFEPINSPGLIVVNRPQQALMRVLQEEILHWNIWQLTLMLAEQWFGFSAKAAGFDDIWLTQSLADSMGLLFLDRTSEYSNLFATLDKEDAYFNLRFRQTQDLIATGLSLMQPHNALVDDNLQSQSGIMDSSPFVFIRSSQAFRVLSQELGRDGYRHFLRLLLLAAITKPLSPQLCYSILKSSGLPRAPELADLLLSYWQSDAWPDAKIDRIEAASDAKNTRVFIGSNSPLAVPLDVEVQATRGRRQTRHVQAGDYALGVEFTLPPEDITRVELDPGRDIYDSDRYNNSTEWPRISFFPGNARSLDDDGYTILWAPFLQKLPGHQLTL